MMATRADAGLGGDPRQQKSPLAQALSAYSDLVPKGGLEPPRPKSLPPQGSASTNSAIWAVVFKKAQSFFGASGFCPPSSDFFTGSAAGAATGTGAGLSEVLAAGGAVGTSPFTGGATGVFGAAGVSAPPMTPRSVAA